MSFSMRPSTQSSADYNHLLSSDLSQLDIDVLITDENGTRKANLRNEFKHNNALIIVQPGASTADEAANWLPKNWKDIEGASGCGAQVEGFHDNLSQFNGRRLYVLNTKSNHADVIKEKNLSQIAFIQATSALISALSLPTFTAHDPRLDAEKTYLSRVNFMVDNGVITSAYTTKDPKASAHQMLCQLTNEKPISSAYQSGSSALYGVKPLTDNTTATPVVTSTVSSKF